MKLDNIEKSSAELLEFIDKMIADFPEPEESEVSESIKKILDVTHPGQKGTH